MPFTRGDSGYHLTREGGHSHRRVIHVADATGAAVQQTLNEKVRAHPNITVLERHIVVDLITGAKLGLGGGEDVHPERNLVVRWASRVLPMIKSFHGNRFAVRTERGWRFTPLLLVLLAIESTDVMFATDSVPAVLAISRDPFVVYTSNIFAILGLRALYFVVAGALGTLRFLRPGLAVILGLIGVKMLLADVVEVPTGVSLAAVAVILAAATAASLILPETRKPAPKRAG